MTFHDYLIKISKAPRNRKDYTLQHLASAIYVKDFENAKEVRKYFWSQYYVQSETDQIVVLFKRWKEYLRVKRRKNDQ